MAMRFAMPNHPFDFEIPDDWLGGLDLTRNRVEGSAYRTEAEATLVALHVIEPPRRNPWVTLDWRGFSRERFLAVLVRMLDDREIDPVPTFTVPIPDRPPSPYGHRIADGYHRFYASVAAGFTHCLAGLSDRSFDAVVHACPQADRMACHPVLSTPCRPG